MNRFIHFELAMDDLEKTAAFYREAFGWKVEKWEGPMTYWLVTSGEQDEPGINGGLMEAGDSFRGTINTIGVDDIDAALERVKAAGGEVVMEKGAIPGVGYQAYFKDSTGILVGLHQGDERAGMGD